MEIGIVGGGGIGSYYAGQMSRAGYSVRLLTRGDHLAAIKERGLEIRKPDETYVAHFEATDDPGRLIGCAYILVSVKGYSLGEIAAPVAAAANGGASVVSLLNGVDVADRLIDLGVPRQSMMGGLVAVSLVRTAPGVVERKSVFDRVVLGELDGPPKPRTSELVSAFTKAGSDARVSEDITLDLWRKWAFIVPMGVACGMLNEPVNGVLASDRGRALVADAVHEIIAVGQAAGVALTQADEDKVRGDLFAITGPIRPSFQLDLDRGGPTELDLQSAAVGKLGRQHGVPTPVNDAAAAEFQRRLEEHGAAGAA